MLIDAHPGSVERIQGRSTILDTVGAVLAPVGVALAGWAGADQRLLLLATGGACLGYAALLASAVVPPPPQRHDNAVPALRRVAANARTVLADRAGRRWLVALLLHELLDLPDLFEPVWLREVVGASQTLVAVHVAVGYLANLAGLVWLDRWLSRHDAGPVLVASCLATLLCYPAWLLTPGVWAKFLLVVPRNLAMAPLWPILRSRALAATPGTAGTVSALSSLTGLLPLAAGFGWAASRAGLTPTMLLSTLAAILALFAVVRSGPFRSDQGQARP